MSERKGLQQQWQRRIRAQEASGLSAATYCRREGLSRKQFYLWRRRLAGAGASGAARRRRGAEAERHWEGIVREQARSGQSVAAFCRERGLCAPQFFVWKKRLAEAGEGTAFVAVEIRPEAAPGTRIELRLTGGHSLLVPTGFDGEHLRALIAALETGR